MSLRQASAECLLRKEGKKRKKEQINRIKMNYQRNSQS
jgi:hypothetical protein